ncbi:MAG: TVP38/TMEM64 family protein [Anaerolineae bacterium]|nr:TVP38/TMEM64 family protein [Anaerolineae bacterium]
MMKKRNTRTIMSIAHVTIVIAVLVGVALYYFSLYNTVNRENIESFVSGFGVWAPVAYAVIYIAGSLIPLLAPMFSAVGGLLFGALKGTLIIMAVATVSALVPYSLSRRLGREWVEAKLKGKKLDNIYQQSEGSKAFTFIVLMRLIPVLPWEIQNYVAGLTKVKTPTFMLGTILGIIPGSFSLAFLGAAATDLMSWQFAAATALKVATALLPVIYLAIQNRKKKQNKTRAEIQGRPHAELTK